MIVYAIYDKPADFPNFFVVRRWIISAQAKTSLSSVPLAPFPGRVDTELEAEWGGTYPRARSTQIIHPTVRVEKACMMATDLKQARKLLPKGVKRIEKDTNEDPTLVEMWV